MFASMKRKANSFCSGKWGAKARALLPLAAGVLLCGFALAAAGHRIAAVESKVRNEAKPVEVVVASVPITAGDTFSERNLAKKAVPSSGTGQRNVPASDFELLLGARARSAIDPGEPVLWTDVEEPYDTGSFSKNVLPGRRAMTLAADTSSSFAGLLNPGDRVDLLVEGSGGDSAAWIRDIPVIAVDQDHNRLAHSPGKSDAATVTVMLRPEEGERIARAAGKVHWFLRNPDDNSVVHARRNGTKAPQAVEIWKGGVRTAAAPIPKEVRE